jgi:hypothetical protein
MPCVGVGHYIYVCLAVLHTERHLASSMMPCVARRDHYLYPHVLVYAL